MPLFKETPQHPEREIRYHLAQDSTLDPWLEQLDLNVISRSIDEYFDTIEGNYYKHGILIRLRNNNTLEIKLNSPYHRDYHFPIPLDASRKTEFDELEELIGLKRPLPFSFPHFLGCNKLRSLVTLDKTRKTYRATTAPHITIAVDTFSELGTFVKFEAQSTVTPYPTETFLRDVEKLVIDLPLVPFNSSYIELALHQTDESLYRQNRKLVG